MFWNLSIFPLDTNSTWILDSAQHVFLCKHFSMFLMQHHNNSPPGAKIPTSIQHSSNIHWFDLTYLVLAFTCFTSKSKIELQSSTASSGNPPFSYIADLLFIRVINCLKREDDGSEAPPSLSITSKASVKACAASRNWSNQNDMYSLRTDVSCFLQILYLTDFPVPPICRTVLRFPYHQHNLKF